MAGTANAVDASQTGFQSLNAPTGVWAGRTITGSAGVTVTNGTGVAGDPVISLTGVNPSSPAFNFRNSIARVNETGNGTVYTLIFDTSVFQNGGANWDGVSTFTAPIAGVYNFSVAFILTNLAAAHTTVQLQMVIAGSTYVTNVNNPGATRDNANNLSVNGNIYVSMAVGNTAQFRVQVTNGALVVGVSNGLINSWVCGALIS